MPTPTVYRTALRGLERLHEGKVRDIYALDARTMLIVTTDRLSAFDVVLPDPIPDKGRVLNSISNFWFASTWCRTTSPAASSRVSSVTRTSARCSRDAR
jgi:phosphoribosylaminoimidazole-succinocarboxamide synthase